MTAATRDDVVDRFWARVNKSGPFHATLGSNCWEWVGSHEAGGYGNLSFRGRVSKAHRVSYQLAVGPIPAGLELDHLCRNVGCVNPSHLEPVTHAENCRRGMAGKYLSRRTHCFRGHEYTSENTMLIRRPRSVVRVCRECDRIQKRARWASTKHLRAPAYKDRTHCPQGHPYAGENLRVGVDGSRACRACDRDRAREAYRRKAAALRAGGAS